MDGWEGKMERLNELLRSPGREKEATTEIAALLSHQDDTGQLAREFVATGALPGLVRLLRDAADAISEVAANALALLVLRNDAEIQEAVFESGAVGALIETIKSDDVDVGVAGATAAIANLCLYEPTRAQVVAAGVVSRLVELLDSRRGRSVQDNAISALGNIAYRHDADRALVVREGVAAPLVKLLRDGTGSQKEKASQLVVILAMNCDENRVELAANGALGALGELLESGSDIEKEKAASALALLALNESNRRELADSNVLHRLVELAQHGREGQILMAVGALSNLVWKETEVRRKVVEAGGLDPIVACMYSKNERVRSVAVRAVGHLSTDASCIEDVVRANSIEALIDILETGDVDQQQYAVVALGDLARGHAEHRVRVGKALAVEALVPLLNDTLLKPFVAGSLADIGFENDVNATAIVNAGALAMLTFMLREGSTIEKERAARALASVAFSDAQRRRVASAGVVPELVELARGGTDALKEIAAIGLGILSSDQAAHTQIKSLGGIEALEALVQSGTATQAMRARNAILRIRGLEANRSASIA